MSDIIRYSISAGAAFDGKSACLWRTTKNESWKMARFQNFAAALQFAEDFNFPLHEDVRAILAKHEKEKGGE